MSASLVSHRPYKPGDDSPKRRGQGTRLRARKSSGQFTQDVQIWQHQRYSDPPALAGAGQKGFSRHSPVGNQQFYPDGLGVECRRTASRVRERLEPNEPNPQADPAVFQVATGNVGSEMIKRIATQPDLELIGLHCYRRRRSARTQASWPGWRRTECEGDRFDRGDHRGQARCADLPRRVPRRGPVRQSPWRPGIQHRALRAGLDHRSGTATPTTRTRRASRSRSSCRRRAQKGGADAPTAPA